MKRTTGGTKVEGGYYWNPSKWSIRAISGESGVLEGGKKDHYLKLPLVVMVPLALLMGGLYVVFLPFIGFAMALYALGRKLGLLSKAALEEAAQTVAPAWRPGEAHFADKADEKAEKNVKASPTLSKLQEEIAKRREDADKKS